jgi:hypothetical protein
MTSKVTPEKLLQTSHTQTSWKERTIPFLGGRPVRDSVITSDDIMNLIIACHTCRNLDEFFLLI